MSLTGRCLCGAVKFELTSSPKSFVHCHCSRCRRAHGAAFVTWVGVQADSFKLVAGREYLKSYHSSPEATRSFCLGCGSPLFFESSRWPGEVSIAAAHITGPLEKTPEAHIFYDERVPWLSVKDALPHCGGVSGTERAKDNNF